MEKKMIIPEYLQSLHDNWHFSPGVLVGDTLYISGAIGISRDGTIPPNPEEQYVAVFENIRAVLELAGATFANLVQMKSYHTNLQYTLSPFSEVRDRYIEDPYPTWTAIGVHELSTKDLIVEVDGVARL